MTDQDKKRIEEAAKDHAKKAWKYDDTTDTPVVHHHFKVGAIYEHPIAYNQAITDALYEIQLTYLVAHKIDASNIHSALNKLSERIKELKK